MDTAVILKKKMKLKFTFKILALLISLYGFNPMAAQFQKAYVANFDQEAHDVVGMPDGGYLLVGYTTNTTINDRDINVIKTDAGGNQVWTKQFGGAKVDFANRMLPTQDGNYFLIGHSQSFGGGDYDVYLVKIDGSGNLLWQKTYGSNGNELGMDIISSGDGNYVIVGYSKASGSTDNNAELWKIDANGTQIWSKTYGGSAHDYGNSVKLCSDGGFIMMGQTYSSGAGSGDAYMVKTDASGNETWSKTFGGINGDEGIYITANTDGSYCFVMRDSSTAGMDIDVKVIKTDASGNVSWTKQYGSNLKDTPKMIQPTSDGGYIVAAISRGFGWINPDMWILKLNSTGDTTWSRHYGGTNNEHCYTMREESDGSFIGCGKTSSYGPSMDAIFIKLNAQGTLVVGLNERNISSKLLKVYPNPTTGTIDVDLTSIEASEIIITDITGRIILKEKTTGLSKETVIIPSKNPGVYFMSVLKGATPIATRKIIVE
jgi:hypothetical protein